MKPVVFLSFLGFFITFELTKGQFIPVNCVGKPFTCTDTTHFIQCVDIGGGVFVTVDTTIEVCPAGTFCNARNAIECAAPTTTRKPTTRRATTTRKPTTRRATTRKPTTRKPTTRKPTTRKPTTRKATTAKPVTPAPADCPRSGNFADSTDCHVYYMCIGSIKYKYYCPPNEVFDASTQKCSTNLDSCKSSTYSCLLNGNYQDPKTCYGYFNCRRSGSSFVITRFNCPILQSFHPFLRKCFLGYGGCKGRILG